MLLISILRIVSISLRAVFMVDQRKFRRAFIDFMRFAQKMHGLEATIEGLDNLDIYDKYILTSNNDGEYSWRMIFSFLRENIRVIAEPAMFGFPLSIFIKKAGFFILNQKVSFVQAKDINRIISRIDAGESVFIFINRLPSAGSVAEKARSGAALLSVSTGTPVIPVAIKHLNKEGPEQRKQMFRITIGSPIIPAEAGFDPVKIDEMRGRIISAIDGMLKR